MPAKRKSLLTYNERYKRARNYGRAYKGMVNVLTRSSTKKRSVPRVNKLVISRVNNLYRMIETKEITWKLESSSAVGGTKYEFPHNNLLVWTQNPFQVSQGAADNMSSGNAPNRIGDQITVKGLALTMFLENAIGRSKVFYRIMVVKCAKGDTIDRNTFFKNNCDNKMIDQVNTERFTVVAQKMFTIAPVNAVGSSNPTTAGVSQGGVNGIATKVVKMWVPGAKFGRGGNVQYENNSYQLKFFDYKVVMLAYDWFGTPQDINNVGLINCMYTKIYFKDA